MTIRDLQRLIDTDTMNQEQEQENPDLNTLKSKLYSSTKRGYKPFYVWPEHTHDLRY